MVLALCLALFIREGQAHRGRHRSNNRHSWKEERLRYKMRKSFTMNNNTMSENHNTSHPHKRNLFFGKNSSVPNIGRRVNCTGPISNCTGRGCRFYNSSGFMQAQERRFNRLMSKFFRRNPVFAMKFLEFMNVSHSNSSNSISNTTADTDSSKNIEIKNDGQDQNDKSLNFKDYHPGLKQKIAEFTRNFHNGGHGNHRSGHHRRFLKRKNRWFHRRHHRW